MGVFLISVFFEEKHVVTRTPTRLATLADLPSRGRWKYFAVRAAIALTLFALDARAADSATCFAPQIDEPSRYAGCSATASDTALPAGVRANAFVALAEMEAARGKHAEALKDYDSALALDAKDTAALLARGKLFEIMGQDDKAATDYTAVVTMKTASAEAFARRGALRLKSNDPAVLTEALEDLIQARRLDSRNETIQRMLGTAQLRTSHNADAIATFSALILMTPRDVEALRGRATSYGREGKYDEAVADLDQVLRLKPDDMDALKARGVAALQANHFDAASKDFTQVLKEKPADVEALFFRATARFRAGDILNAIADFDAVLALRPRDPDALAGRGLARVTAGDLANGETDFSAVLATEPKAITVLTYRGQLRVLRGDYAGAVKDLTVAMALAPANAEIAVWRTMAERRAGAKGTDALSAARRKFSESWPLPAARFLLGEIDGPELTAQAATDQQTSEAAYVIGQNALARGDRADAVRHFTTATATNARGSFAYIGAKIELAKLTAQ